MTRKEKKIDIIKKTIGQLAWKIFIWSIPENETQYWEEVAKTEIAINPRRWKRYIKEVENV
jgi:hypothetical protein